MLTQKAPVLQAGSSGWLSGKAVEYLEAGTSGKFLGLCRCVPVSHSGGAPWLFLQDGGC